MKLSRKYPALGLALLLLILSLAACGGADGGNSAVRPEAPAPEARPPAADDSGGASRPEEAVPQSVTLSVAALKGPTGMGLVKLLHQFGVLSAPQEAPMVEDLSENGGSYTFVLAASADEITPALIQGELDMACVPANLACVLYHRTQGEIVTLGINTLGVLYILENGGTVRSMADLKGRTIVAAGKGQTPEYGLRYLLAQSGIDPDKDVTIEWKSEHSECVAAIASGAADIALLPQPFVTVAQGKIEGLRIALDLTAEWEALDNGSAMVTGVVVARKSVVENFPAAVDAFLADYAASVEWVNDNSTEAAELIGGYGIVEAAVAEKALPYCNIVCVSGEEMKEKLSGYLEVLFEQDPTSVGGELPGEDFYHGA